MPNFLSFPDSQQFLHTFHQRYSNFLLFFGNYLPSLTQRTAEEHDMVDAANICS